MVDVWDAGIESMGTGRRVHVGGIACDEHSLLSVSVSEPQTWGEERQPGRVMDSQIRPSCPDLKKCDHRRLVNLWLLVVGERNHELKCIDVRQRANADRAMLGWPNPPFVPREVINADIAEYDAASCHRLADEADSKRCTHYASPPVGAHQIFRVDVGRLPACRNRGGSSASTLF